MALLSIIQDSREADWCKDLKFGGVPSSISLLDAGDLLAICDDAVIAIERKEASDFCNTLRDGRLFPQLAKMKEVTEWCYLALVGSILPGPNGLCSVDGRQTQWNWASISGALVSVQEMGVVVVEVPHGAEYEATILRLANRDRAPMRIHPPRDAVLVSDAEAILGALPGIGPDRAKALVDYAGSPAWALQFLTDDTCLNDDRVPGIGAGVKRRIRKAFGLEDWQSVSVVMKETGDMVALNTNKMERVA